LGTGTCLDCDGIGYTTQQRCPVCDTTGACTICRSRGYFLGDDPRTLVTITPVGGVL